VTSNEVDSALDQLYRNGEFSAAAGHGKCDSIVADG